MVKEYLKEKADSLTAEKERLTAQKAAGTDSEGTGRGNGKAGQVSVHARRGAESAGLIFHMFHVKHFQDFGMLKTGYLKKEVL